MAANPGEVVAARRGRSLHCYATGWLRSASLRKAAKEGLRRLVWNEALPPPGLVLPPAVFRPDPGGHAPPPGPALTKRFGFGTRPPGERFLLPGFSRRSASPTADFHWPGRRHSRAEALSPFVFASGRKGIPTEAQREALHLQRTFRRKRFGLERPKEGKRPPAGKLPKEALRFRHSAGGKRFNLPARPPRGREKTPPGRGGA